MRFYPNNLPQSFKVQLPRERWLDGAWEVALVDIQFPHTWYNFDKDTHCIVFTQITLEGRLLKEGTKNLFGEHFGGIMDELRFTIPKGFYPTAKDICERLKYEISVEYRFRGLERPRNYWGLDNSTFLFDFDMVTHKATLSDFTCSPTFPSNYLFTDDAGGHFAALGLESSKFEPEISPNNESFELWESDFKHLNFYRTPLTSTKPVAVLNNPVINVYCNIMDSQVVGDSDINLLRTVPVTKEYSEVVTSAFPLPFYMPISCEYIKAIEIELKNENGQLINFHSGQVIVTLHFRKCELD